MISVFILALNFGVGFATHHTSSMIARPFWLSIQQLSLRRCVRVLMRTLET